MAQERSMTCNYFIFPHTITAGGNKWSEQAGGLKQKWSLQNVWLTGELIATGCSGCQGY